MAMAEMTTYYVACGPTEIEKPFYLVGPIDREAAYVATVELQETQPSNWLTPTVLTREQAVKLACRCRDVGIGCIRVPDVYLSDYSYARVLRALGELQELGLDRNVYSDERGFDLPAL